VLRLFDLAQVVNKISAYPSTAKPALIERKRKGRPFRAALSLDFTWSGFEPGHEFVDQCLLAHCIQAGSVDTVILPFEEVPVNPASLKCVERLLVLCTRELWLLHIVHSLLL